MTFVGQIGSYHLNNDIDTVTAAIISVFTTFTGKVPKFKVGIRTYVCACNPLTCRDHFAILQVHGGTNAENLALQNIQARTRMVFSYLLAQLLPWVRGVTGSLLVLGSANVDETCVNHLQLHQSIYSSLHLQ